MEAYHTSNAQLDAIIGVLRGQLDELQVSTACKCVLSSCVAAMSKYVLVTWIHGAIIRVKLLK